MPSHVSTRRVTAGRKKTFCHDCLQDIGVGQPRLVNTWVDGSDIYPWNTCTKCEEFLTTARKWMGSAVKASAERLDEQLEPPFWEDGYHPGWLIESFDEGLEIGGFVFREREQATAYLNESLGQQSAADNV